MLAALWLYPLAPRASWQAEKCLHLHRLSVLAGGSEVRTGYGKLALWHLQQALQELHRTLVRQCFGPGHCWARQGLARRVEVA